MMISGFRISKQLLTNTQKVVYVELGQHVKVLLVVVTGVDIICDQKHDKLIKPNSYITSLSMYENSKKNVRGRRERR
jgi:hypothetical protein